MAYAFENAVLIFEIDSDSVKIDTPQLSLSSGLKFGPLS